MKGKNRYIFLLCSLPFLVFFHYFLLYKNKQWTDSLTRPSWKWRNELPRYLGASYTSSIQRRKPESFNTRNCRMETCFNFSKCKGKDRAFKVYVYPEDVLGGQRSPSGSYEKVKKSFINCNLQFAFFKYLYWFIWVTICHNLRIWPIFFAVLDFKSCQRIMVLYLRPRRSLPFCA